MKNYSTHTKGLIILAFSLLLGHVASAQYEWHYVGDYSGIYSMYDADNFCIKDGAFAKVSQDGGATFSNLGLPASPLLAVHYISANELMALSSAGGSLELFHSTDGGLNFTSKGNVLDPSILLGLSNRDFYFLNADVGFIFQQVSYDGDLIDVLFKTIDGGQNWAVVEDTTAFDVSVNMYFDEEGNIFAAGNISGQGLYVSQDTGKSFTKLAGSIPVYSSGLNLAYDGQQTFFVNDVPGSGNSCCYISTDGGATFSPWASSASGGDDLAFNGPNQVLVFGGSDTTALSVDNGQTFNTVRFGADKPSGSFYFIHASDNGKAFYLNDGNAKLWVYEGSSIGVSENILHEEIAVFPNPATESISLEIPQHVEILDVNVLDLSGQVLLNQTLVGTSQQLDISTLPVGVYILTVYAQDINFAPVRFIKQ